jgi:hypothetical protein
MPNDYLIYGFWEFVEKLEKKPNREERERYDV